MAGGTADQSTTSDPLVYRGSTVQCSAQLQYSCKMLDHETNRQQLPAEPSMATPTSDRNSHPRCCCSASGGAVASGVHTHNTAAHGWWCLGGRGQPSQLSAVTLNTVGHVLAGRHMARGRHATITSDSSRPEQAKSSSRRHRREVRAPGGGGLARVGWPGEAVCGPAAAAVRGTRGRRRCCVGSATV